MRRGAGRMTNEVDAIKCHYRRRRKEEQEARRKTEQENKSKEEEAEFIRNFKVYKPQLPYSPS